MEKFRWCFIGTGALARAIAPSLLESGRHLITSVYSRRLESSQDFTSKFGGVAYDNPKEAISRDDVDGVYVVTPHSSHHEYTKLALELGKPVLNEKAFTLNAKSTKNLIELARSKDIYLTEAMWTWFAEPPYKVREWINNDYIGKVKRAKFTYFMPPQDPNGRLFDPERGGGALLDIGIYPITYAYRLFGYPEDIICRGHVKGGVDLHEKIILKYKDEMFVECFVSMVGADYEEGMEIFGEKGKIYAKDFHTNDTVHLEAEEESKDFTGTVGYLNEFDKVAGEIQSGATESVYVPHKATYDVMKIMDECRRQMNLYYPAENLF